MITIYGFLEEPALNGGWEVSVVCQCGTRLLQRVSANAQDAQHDIGVTSQEQHELYRTHCAEQHQGEPSEIDWVHDPANDQRLRQPGVEVLDWSRDEFFSLADQLQKAFSEEQEKPSKPSEDNL